MRSLEEDTPDLDDYLTLNSTRERNNRKSFFENGKNSLENILKQFPIDPNLPNTWILNQKKHFLDSSKDQNKLTDENDILQQQSKNLSEED